MKKIMLCLVVSALGGCQALPPQQCSATARIGGQDVSVPIYGIKKVANQTQYYAGNPFGWKWVSMNPATAPGFLLPGESYASRHYCINQ